MTVVECHQDPHNYKQLETAIASLSDATEKVDSIKAEVSQKVEQTSVLYEEVQKIQKLLEDTMQSSANIAEASRKKTLELDSLKASNNDKGDIVEGKKIELSEELLKWKTTLGLELVNSSHGGIIFVFTNIDREYPDKKFNCEVGLSDKVYKVNNCSPVLEDIDAMVEYLNKSNDLSGFVVTLRKRFLTLRK